MSFNNMGLSLAELKDIVSRLRYCHVTNYGRYYISKKNRRPKENLARRTKHFEFSVMSYNILSQDLVARHSDLYQSCSDAALQWPDRGQRILRELNEVNADLVCLQEVHCDHYEQMYRPSLEKLGYSGLFKKRTGDKRDGCALFYKRSIFLLENAVDIEFCQREVATFLNRDNVAIIGVFKPILNDSNEDQKIVVATTHLLFNPKRGDIKLAQLRVLLAELDKLARKTDSNDYYPTVFCGDFNTEPYSPIYRFVNSGYLDPRGLYSGELSGQHKSPNQRLVLRQSELHLNGIDNSSKFVQNEDPLTADASRVKGEVDIHNWEQCKPVAGSEEGIDAKPKAEATPTPSPSSSVITHNFKFSSVYPNRNLSNEDFVTTFHDKAACIVDYIFYSRSDRLKLLSYKKLFTVRQMQELNMSLPNEYLGSDHFSLVSKFVLLNE